MSAQYCAVLLLLLVPDSVFVLPNVDTPSDSRECLFLSTIRECSYSFDEQLMLLKAWRGRLSSSATAGLPAVWLISRQNSLEWSGKWQRVAVCWYCQGVTDRENYMIVLIKTPAWSLNRTPQPPFLTAIPLLPMSLTFLPQCICLCVLLWVWIIYR